MLTDLKNNDNSGGHLVLAGLFLLTIIVLLSLSPWARNGDYLWIQQSVGYLLGLTMVALLLCQNSVLRQSHRRELARIKQDREHEVLFVLINEYNHQIMQQATNDFWNCYRAWRNGDNATIIALPERISYYRELACFWTKVALAHRLSYVSKMALFSLFPNFSIIEKYLPAYGRLAGNLQPVADEIRQLADADGKHQDGMLGSCLQNLEFLEELGVETAPQLLFLYLKAAPDQATLRKIREVGAEFKGKDREHLVFIKIKGFIDKRDIRVYLEEARQMESSQSRLVTKGIAGLAIDGPARRLAAQKQLAVFICRENKFVKADELSPEALAAFTSAQNVVRPKPDPKSESVPAQVTVDAPDENCPLSEILLRDMAGERLAMIEVYEIHKSSCDNIFSKREYKEALIELEQEKKIITDPPASERPKRGRKLTFADSVVVIFPPAQSD